MFLEFMTMFHDYCVRRLYSKQKERFFERVLPHGRMMPTNISHRFRDGEAVCLFGYGLLIFGQIFCSCHPFSLLSVLMNSVSVNWTHYREPCAQQTVG